MNDSDELDPADFKLPLYALILIFLVCWTTSVFSEPKYRSESANGIVVTLHSEPCQLTDVVVNLPGHATWEEKGQVSIGCWGGADGIVMFYWADKNIGHAPQFAFQVVQGT